MVIILYLWYIQDGAPKLLLMAQALKHPQSESVLESIRICPIPTEIPLSEDVK